MLDAYTVRKAIPRIVIAVIAINLSIYLCVAALDVTEIIGRGINQLLVGPFVNDKSFSAINQPDPGVNGILGIFGFDNVLKGIFTTIFGAALFGGAGALGLLGTIGPLLITIVLIVLAVLFTLIIRQGLLVFLIVVSPVAIVCSILPGTEKFFKQWLDMFIKTLMVYPIIAIIFAMSNVLGAILLTGSSASIISSPASVLPVVTNFAQTPASDGNIIRILVAIIVMYAPLFLIPFSFKLAGGAIGQIANIASRGAKVGGANLGGRFRKSQEDQDSLAGRAKARATDRRVKHGLTGKQLSAAAIPRRDRRQRMDSAREYQQLKGAALAAEGTGYKLNAQDSDVNNSLAMSDSQLSDSKKHWNEKLQTATQSGDTDGVKVATRKLTAAATAESMGRTQGQRAAAFKNVDRLKYLEDENGISLKGEKGYKYLQDQAADIYGGNSASTLGAMTAASSIAAGPAGRSDLSGELYNQDFSSKRITGKNSAGQVLQGTPSSVDSVISTAVKTINTPTASVQEKESAVQMLTSLQSSASSSFGPGSEASKAAVKQQANKITGAYQTFAEDPNAVTSSYHNPDEYSGKISVSQGEIKNEVVSLGYEEHSTDAAGNSTTRPAQDVKKGPAAVVTRLNRLAGQAPDQALLQQQQQQQQQGQQGGSGSGSGTGSGTGP